MTLSYMKPAAAAVWVCTPLAIGLVTQPQSFGSWAALTLLATIPPAIVMYLWREPVASTSEAIRDALR